MARGRSVILLNGGLCFSAELYAPGPSLGGLCIDSVLSGSLQGRMEIVHTCLPIRAERLAVHRALLGALVAVLERIVLRGGPSRVFVSGLDGVALRSDIQKLREYFEDSGHGLRSDEVEKATSRLWELITLFDRPSAVSLREHYGEVMLLTEFAMCRNLLLFLCGKLSEMYCRVHGRIFWLSAGCEPLFQCRRSLRAPSLR